MLVGEAILMGILDANLTFANNWLYTICLIELQNFEHPQIAACQKPHTYISTHKQDQSDKVIIWR